MIWRTSNPTDRIRVEKIPGIQIDKKKLCKISPNFIHDTRPAHKDDSSPEDWVSWIYISQRLAHKTFRTMSVDTLHSELQRGLQVVLIKCGEKLSQRSVHKQLHNTLFYLLINNSSLSLSLIISTWKSGFLSMISGYVFIHKKQSGFKQIQVFLTFRIHIY